ncbi:CUE domain-containing protein 2 [Drosophila miranda]|uniref:CUE domain-containing protein 2 n=1 Tax=Drosophila pseudoobscura pseudoobscura TaxID=46245 RepID=A0A6I8UP43_DROPS|nr:CUE domain-containing protein 2 [Drosophila pseudoobscura]XP_017144200.1 CUE domain-containing protein 2 [Drosophila miranda]XP_017144201.1 CUE domain-containing protein 2 [Drosophila miranda]
MTNLEKQHEMVKHSLVEFISGHIPGADFRVVDEIVLSYIISILEEASQDPCFDVEGFVEMMGAYFEEFPTIDQGVICDWIYKLANELTEMEKNQGNHDAVDLSLNLLSLSNIIPESRLRARNSSISEKDELSSNNSSSGGSHGKRSQHLSETSDGGSTDSSSSNCDYFFDEAEALQEMFPDAAYVEIKHCIAISKGDIDSATQILLHRQETNQSLTDKSHSMIIKKNVVVDDNELKNRIIARYSYVDKNATQREYKPVVPKMEPRKLVRYRDNKIVSLKGERYTEIKRDEDAELKKPKKQIQP